MAAHLDHGALERDEAVATPQHATAFSRIASIALRGYLAALRRVAR